MKKDRPFRFIDEHKTRNRFAEDSYTVFLKDQFPEFKAVILMNHSKDKNLPRLERQLKRLKVRFKTIFPDGYDQSALIMITDNFDNIVPHIDDSNHPKYAYLYMFRIKDESEV